MTYLTLFKTKSVARLLAAILPTAILVTMTGPSAAAPIGAEAGQALAGPGEVAFASLFLNCCSNLGSEAAIGLLLLLAVGLWVRILPRNLFRKPDTRLTNSRCKTEVLLDTSLPRSLRRDGWWLES